MPQSANIVFSEKHIPNFVLDRFTVPLSYKLAVAAFMDAESETSHIMGFENFGGVCNEGSIIREAGVKSPFLSQRMQSKAIFHLISDLLKTPDIILRFWHNFRSSLSKIRKRLFYGILF